MRGFILIAVMAVAIHARPEPPRNGYNYPQPAPLPSVNQGYSSSNNGGGYVNGGYQSSGVSSNFQQQQNFQPQQNFQAQQNFQPQQNFQQSFQPQPQTIVQKHIYVHVPPPEEEYEQQQQQQSFSAPRKHYKIIFIKAPSAPSLTQQIAAAQAQNQEKTLIYVLVKKPEEYSAGAVAAPVPELPVSKPEVYFIKYKTQKTQQQQQQQVASSGQDFSAAGNYQSGGQSITDYQAPNPSTAYGPPAHKK